MKSGKKYNGADKRCNITDIWEDFLANKTEQSRNSLMENYLPLVKYIAERIYAKLPDKVELDDLISAGIFGLMDAIDEFDPERGVKFETYCAPRIRGSILDELRSMDWVPRLVRAGAHQLEILFSMKEDSLKDETVDAIVEFYNALNSYHIACGGNGLVVDRWQTVHDDILAGAGK